jgi:hypothetical protein
VCRSPPSRETRRSKETSLSSTGEASWKLRWQSSQLLRMLAKAAVQKEDTTNPAARELLEKGIKDMSERGQLWGRMARAMGDDPRECWPTRLDGATWMLDITPADDGPWPDDVTPAPLGPPKRPAGVASMAGLGADGRDIKFPGMWRSSAARRAMGSGPTRLPSAQGRSSLWGEASSGPRMPAAVCKGGASALSLGSSGGAAPAACCLS